MISEELTPYLSPLGFKDISEFLSTCNCVLYSYNRGQYCIGIDFSSNTMKFFKHSNLIKTVDISIFNNIELGGFDYGKLTHLVKQFLNEEKIKEFEVDFEND